MSPSHSSLPLRSLLVLCAVFSAASVGGAAVSVPPIFSDNMVVQQEVPMRVWGTADPGEEITVLLGDKSLGHARAGADGRWEIAGEAQKAGPLPDLIIKGSNTITVKNVLAGEVWLCSGQSNMQMTVSATPECPYGGVVNEREEVAAADHPEIRFFNKSWEVCSPETIGRASATAYFFGRDLQRELRTPVGLVTKAVGGTVVEAWLPPSAWTDDLTKDAIAAYVPFYNQLDRRYRDELVRSEKSGASGGTNRKKPSPPVKPEDYPVKFSKLFTSLLAPVAGYPLAGVLWYQGESNTPRSGAYRELLSALITGWRQEWREPDLPFIIVQLPEYKAGGAPGPDAEKWPEVREKQAQVAANIPGTSLVVALGAGDPGNLHPRNKQEIGRRAMLRALDVVYDQDRPSEGPVLKSVEWKPEEVVLGFANAAEGMTVAGADQPAIEIAGPDKIFRAAPAKVEGSVVRVSTAGVSAPRWIRYAWANDPRGLLMNRANLVAGPFERENR